MTVGMVVVFMIRSLRGRLLISTMTTNEKGWANENLANENENEIELRPNENENESRPAARELQTKTNPRPGGRGTKRLGKPSWPEAPRVGGSAPFGILALPVALVSDAGGRLLATILAAYSPRGGVGAWRAIDL